MFEHKKLQDLSDYFLELKNRKETGVYFYRICTYNEQIHAFIQKYFEAARASGVIIEGKIANPTEKNLAYYSEMMGMDFQMSVGFFAFHLKKWLPRMNDGQRQNVAAAVYDALDALRRSGKNENMLRNAYIKFMCWLYYKFERIVNQLGKDQPPKILYEGDVGSYERMMLSVLSNAGCDVVLLQYKGDGAYRKLDPKSIYSDEWKQQGAGAFPDYFNLKWMQNEILEQAKRERLCGPKPSVENCTNAWIAGKGLLDVLTLREDRGSDPAFFYNCFLQINGVEDKLSCVSDLHQFYLSIRKSGRGAALVENEISKPTMEEIGGIRRKNYDQKEHMLLDLSANLSCSFNEELQRLMKKAFVSVLEEASLMQDMNLNKLTNKAVYLLCWLKRFQAGLFSKQTPPETGCFIYLNGCKNENEALFLRFLAKLPVDVLILNPGRQKTYPIADPVFYEINYTDVFAMDEFPADGVKIRMGTAAYHAEREPDALMYQDSGMYRSQQYKKAEAVTLSTTYEEIAILWDQELKFRPNFSTMESVVALPVMFAKVSGVKDADVTQYWAGIKTLMTKDVFLVKNAPYLKPVDVNPIKAHAAEFFKNRKLMREKIKSHKCYPYGALRKEVQEHILDKLALLIQQKTIKGTFLNGMEYTVISTVLNLPKEIARLLQKFDFTKKNPKFVYINTTEEMPSLEDAILAAFLNLAGFDVLYFTPAGYQGIESYYNENSMEEHQIGEYLYDLSVPDFNRESFGGRLSWREKIFKRGK